jgi:glutamate decarboxylase
VPTALARDVGAMPEYRLISDGSELPVFAFTTAEHITGWDVFAVSRGLREHGWQVPAYTFPANRADLAVLRVVCRNGFSHDLAEVFLRHLHSVTRMLTTNLADVGRSGSASFHH